MKLLDNPNIGYDLQQKIEEYYLTKPKDHEAQLKEIYLDIIRDPSVLSQEFTNKYSIYLVHQQFSDKRYPVLQQLVILEKRSKGFKVYIITDGENPDLSLALVELYISADINSEEAQNKLRASISQAWEVCNISRDPVPLENKLIIQYIATGF